MSQFDCCQLQLACPIMEHHSVRNLQHIALQTTFDMFDQSQHLLNTLHKSFLFAFQLHFYMDGITDSMDMSVSKLQEIVKDREAWHAAVHGMAKSWT